MQQVHCSGACETYSKMLQLHCGRSNASGTPDVGRTECWGNAFPYGLPINVISCIGHQAGKLTMPAGHLQKYISMSVTASAFAGVTSSSHQVQCHQSLPVLVQNLGHLQNFGGQCGV